MAEAFTYKGKPYSFRQVALNYHKVRMQVPGVLATIAVNYFKDSFRRQGWRDLYLQPWQPRKAGSQRNKGRAILVNRGILRNGIRIQQADIHRIVIVDSVPYAVAHNEGFHGTVTVKKHTRHTYEKTKVQYTTRKGTSQNRFMRKQVSDYEVRAHERKMNLPQRQFMGDSEIMGRKFDQALIRAIDKVFELS